MCWGARAPLPLPCAISSSIPLLRELKGSLEALLGIHSRDLFKVLGVCKQGTQPGKNRMCPKEDRRVTNFYSEKYSLENYQPCTLSPRIGPEQVSIRRQAVRMVDARLSGRRGPGGHVRSRWPE